MHYGTGTICMLHPDAIVEIKNSNIQDILDALEGLFFLAWL